MAISDDGEKIVSTFKALGVDCSLSRVVVAAQVVRYEICPGPGTRMMDYRRLSRADDLAAALEASSVMLQCPIPGTGLIGVEVSRKDRAIVNQSDLPPAMKPLTVPVGFDVDNRPTLLVLDESPHALVAGMTGGGKSSFLRTVLAGLLSGLGPEHLRLCLIDPKRVEMSSFEGLPHLLFPVADDVQKAIDQLCALAINMDDRYLLLQELGARDIKEANAKLIEMGHDPLPYFVCVIDELAELMMTSGKEVESVLVRIAQKGRAAGLHMILATQYPLRNILTGLLRANLPTRVAFAVTDMTASRVVLDRNGAEKLLGKGDALFSFAGLPPVRFQSAFCSPERVAQVVARWKTPTREEVTA